MAKKSIVLVFLILTIAFLNASEKHFSKIFMARLKYSGGGDWYNDVSTIPNMMKEFSIRTGIPVNQEQIVTGIMDDMLFNCPILYLTGHGNIKFSQSEKTRLKEYLEKGGFLYIDDDYGLDPFIRREFTEIYGKDPFIEIPLNHTLYNIFYSFPKGVIKIHEHEKELPPKCFGIFHKNRLVCLYTFNSNISDGWVDAEVHKNPPEIREQAFQFGVNIILTALTE